MSLTPLAWTAALGLRVRSQAWSAEPGPDGGPGAGLRPRGRRSVRAGAAECRGRMAPRSRLQNGQESTSVPADTAPATRSQDSNPQPPFLAAGVPVRGYVTP